MSMQEWDRTKIIEDLVKGEIKTAVAALRMQLSPRQVLRLADRFRLAGPAGMISARRGKPSNRQLLPGLAQKALQIVHEHYADFGPTFACEKLRECHDLVLSKETVRRLMVESGLWTPRSARQARLHQPRERRHCRGELVQIDGSPHAWFERRAPACALLVYVDDATGQLLQLHFAQTESTFSYFEATRRYLEQHGKPRTFYADKAAVFRSPSKNRRSLTQFARALDDLDIDLICANSAQAKGRVERMNRSLQDRLVKELRLAGIDSIEAANAWGAGFIEHYNRRFAHPPHNPLDLHKPVGPNEDLALILSICESRKLSAKLTLQYGPRLYLLADTPAARAHAGQRLALHTYADGRVEVRADGKVLPHTTLERPSAKRPIEVDAKTLSHTLDELASKTKKRNRLYRNPTGAQIAAGVTIAKQEATRKAVRARTG
jgi:hypothetical protein